LSEFVQEANASIKDAEGFLIPLMREGKIKGKLEIRCPNCEKDLGTFGNLSEIPEEIECDICGYRFSRSLEYVEIILEVTGEFFRAQNGTSNSCQKALYKRGITTVTE
jgi:ribosomal protein S27E